jgi:hypothetical protein
MEIFETEKIKGLTDQVKDYVQTRIEIAKLSAVKTGSKAASNAALYIVLAVIGFFFLMFISLGAAIAIGYAMDSWFGGFFIISGFYLMVGIICYAFRSRLIVGPVSNAVINGILNKEEVKP